MLTITAIADPDRCPDLEALAEQLQRELRVLSGIATPAPHSI
jgi:hypothetical protein